MSITYSSLVGDYLGSNSWHILAELSHLSPQINRHCLCHEVLCYTCIRKDEVWKHLTVFFPLKIVLPKSVGAKVTLLILLGLNYFFKLNLHNVDIQNFYEWWWFGTSVEGIDCGVPWSNLLLFFEYPKKYQGNTVQTPSFQTAIQTLFFFCFIKSAIRIQSIL
jgi:hypothetical protein